MKTVSKFLLTCAISLLIITSCASSSGSASTRVEEKPKLIVKKDNNPGIERFTLYILHTNDIHGHLDGEEGAIKASQYRSLIENIKTRSGGNLLVMDAGDMPQGTNYVNYFNGLSAFDVMSSVGVDCYAPGNHDFDFGFDNFEKNMAFIRQAGMEPLSFNIKERGVRVLSPYIVYDFNGFKVGVIGATTPETKTSTRPSGVKNLDFGTAAFYSDLQSIVDKLRKKEGCKYIVVLSHLGVEESGSGGGFTSISVAEKVKGINLIVDGHSHTVIPNGKRISPNGTLIAQTGTALNNIGFVTVKIEKGEVASDNARLISAADVKKPVKSPILRRFKLRTVSEEKNVANKVLDYIAQIENEYNAVVGNLTEDLDGDRAIVRGENAKGETAKIGTLIAEAYKKATNSDIGFLNGGSIRANIPKGDLTLGKVKTALPYSNYLNVVEITPKAFYEAVEYGLSFLPEASGAFPHSSASFTYSPDAPKGQRLAQITVDGNVLNKEDDKTKLKVAVTNFVSEGGDGYTQFNKVVEYTQIDDAKALLDYLKGENTESSKTEDSSKGEETVNANEGEASESEVSKISDNELDEVIKNLDEESKKIDAEQEADSVNAEAVEEKLEIGSASI